MLFKDFHAAYEPCVKVCVNQPFPAGDFGGVLGAPSGVRGSPGGKRILAIIY